MNKATTTLPCPSESAVSAPSARDTRQNGSRGSGARVEAATINDKSMNTNTTSTGIDPGPASTTADVKSTGNGVEEVKLKFRAEVKGRPAITPLTPEERKRWKEYKKAVHDELKTCLASYIVIGRFLTLIHGPVRSQEPGQEPATGLYREDYPSFEVYCRKELGIARSTAYGYMLEYEMTTKLSEISDTSRLTKEIHLRPIIRLQAPEREQALEILKAEPPTEFLTPEILKSIADKVISTRPAPPPASTGANPGKMAVFIENIRRVVQKAEKACPGQQELLAKGLRDIAAALEGSARKQVESTITE